MSARRNGFTLLEVIVAISILAVSLVSILSISSQAVAAHIYAKKLTIATLLARAKMTDLEQDLYDKPLSADDEDDEGDFSDEGFASYKWRSKIIVPKTNGLTPEQLFGALFNLPLGGGGDGKDGNPMSSLLGGMFGVGGASSSKTAPGQAPAAGSGAGSLLAGAAGPMAGMMQQQFTAMVDTLQKSVREVHLTVSWKEGKQTESIDLVTHIVTMGIGSDRNGGNAAVAGGAAPGTPGTPGAPGTPGLPGLPGVQIPGMPAGLPAAGGGTFR